MGKIIKSSNLKKTIHYLKKNGPRKTCYAIWERTLQGAAQEEPYREPDDSTLLAQKSRGMEFHTRFSILVPAYETREEYLCAMLDSVLAQTYGNFEVILADASSSDRVEKAVSAYTDGRIQYYRLGENKGISGNTQEALLHATGEYIALLDHDDLLTADALYEMAFCIAEWKKSGREPLLLYSDEDKLDSESGQYFEANRKQKFNIDLIMSNNYICHLLVLNRKMAQKLGFRSVYDGAQDYDLILRAVSDMRKQKKAGDGYGELPIAHIPKILYHWRCHLLSTAENPESKRYAYEAGKAALEDFMREQGFRGTVAHMPHLGFYRVEYQPTLFANRPDVAVIGGRLLDKRNRIAGGIYAEDGSPLYLGLHKEFSGYMHRACLRQEAEAVDVRCIQTSSEGEKVLEELLGVPYRKDAQTGCFLWRAVLKEDTDYLELSLKFCKRIREMGYRIVWDPVLEEHIR